MSKVLKTIVRKHFAVKQMQEETRKALCCSIKESFRTFFEPKTMRIASKDAPGFADWKEDLWEPPAAYFELHRKIVEITDRFNNIDEFLNQDTLKI